ncbi:MAG: hypothetical protein ACR2LS_03285 [Thermomicrobiales bacterium]
MSRIRSGWIAGTIACLTGAIILAVPVVREFVDDHPGAMLAMIAIAASLLAWSGARLITALSAIAVTTRTLARTSQAASRDLTGPIPVIAFELSPEPRVTQFVLRVENVGNGPALDLDVLLAESPLNYRLEPPARGRALGPGMMFEVTFILQEEQPFRQPDHPCRWPRNQEDAAVIREAAEPPKDDRSGVIVDPTRHLARLEELQKRYGDYRREVRATIVAEVTASGMLRARYQDLGQVRRISAAPLVLNKEGLHTNHPAAPSLGTLSVQKE